MLRIITSLIRNAPGPFKGARALTADFVEGLVDVIKPPADLEQPPPTQSPAAPQKTDGAGAQPPSTPKDQPAGEETKAKETKAEAEETKAKETKAEAEETKAEEAEAPETEPEKGEERADQDWDQAYAAAVEVSRWVRRQDFKVLAIFWKARERSMGPITAKDAAVLGDDIGLSIRHENIRKVIRTRLEESIETTTVPDSQPPTYQYEMTDDGASFFVDEYLKKALEL